MLFAQAPKLGNEFQGGIVCIVDSAKHKAVVFRSDAQQIRMPWNDAVNLIEEIEDTTDVQWRLPAIYELEKIFMNRDLLPMLPEKCYWSSSIDLVMKSRLSEMSREVTSMDGNIYDPDSSGEQYIETLDFFSRVKRSFKKTDSQFVLLVRGVDW